ncbi:MAG TPA: primosomal protein N' [Clostridiaceae bacterium]|nr:primosomal protein N' [Clostridiaceae bacterium]
MSLIASIVLDNCTRDFDIEYHYIVPENLSDCVRPGIRVIVPFGKADRAVEAYVLKVFEDSETRELKEIKKVLDDKPVLNEGLLRLAEWMKKRYICTYSDAIRCMLPAGIGVKSIRTVKLQEFDETQKESNIKLKGNIKKIIDLLKERGNECEYDELKEAAAVRSFSRYINALEEQGIIKIYEEYSSRVREKTVRVAYLKVPEEVVVEEIEGNRIKRIQHIRVLQMLMENEYISVADITRFAGVSSSVLDTLKKYGYIDFKDMEVIREPMRNREVERVPALKPTAQQANVLSVILKKLDKGAFDEILLHGVTGSGKTEVYLQLIEHIIKMDKQAIVLVPEISLTPQMVYRFKSRFGNEVAVLHSRLSPGERYDQWRLIRDGRIKVAVGARSAVFAPFDRIGMIVIDEEHESSYKSETTPKYHASEIARQRCMDSNAILLYGSATPSVQTYYRAKKGEIELLEMSERTNDMELPKMTLVDMRKELESGNRSIFSRKLETEIASRIKNGQQTMLFLNRRGYASFVLCRNCGYTMKCVNCDITMTYHSSDDRLICHYCGYTIKTPKLCPKCNSRHIRQFGVGTQKVEEEIKKVFPQSSVIRMDMDTTTYKNSHEDILRKFREENINIMVGTQMIAKGHDFHNVTLVGILAADGLLNVGDYWASERTFQLITQMAGRAGRGEIPGEVVIQTYNTEDFSILAACKNDYNCFYEQEIQIREKLGYPPFTCIGLIIIKGTRDRLVFESAKTIRASIEQFLKNFNYTGDFEILGPARAPIAWMRNRYRWRIIIKGKNRENLLDVLTYIYDEYNKKMGRNNVELNVDINPQNML